MKAYCFDNGGVFTEEYECQKDPVKSKNEGVDRYLMPANATQIAPPDFDTETQKAVWDGSAWNIQEKEIIDPESQLLQFKSAKIMQSKSDLAAYLESHPLPWTDGEHYSITAERQAQLTSTIVCAKADGQPPEWNSTGGVCREWDVQELTSLGVAIKNRVKALVKYQQEKELEILASQTQEELDAIGVDYDTVSTTDPEASQ